VKAAIAKERGALAMIIVNDKLNGHPDLDVTIPQRYGEAMARPYLCLPQGESEIPVIYATEQVALSLTERTGVDVWERQARIDRSLEPASAELKGKRVIIEVRLAEVERREVANVMGVIPGTDQRRTGEYILVGAHHDHLGSDSKGRFYPGADDNASGTAGMLETARLLVEREGGLPRSVLFVSFCGEEKGLLGSNYFLAEPPVELSNVKAMIDLDMIGRNNMDKEENEGMFIVFTSAQTPYLGEVVRSIAGEQGIDVRLAPYLSFRGASDHANFHRAGIPVMFYFSGYHRDYHQVTDRVEKIVPGKMEMVVRHLVAVLEELARAPADKFSFDRTIRKAPARDEFERPY